MDNGALAQSILGHCPKFFQLVNSPGFLVEHMNNDVAIVLQNPLAGLVPLKTASRLSPNRVRTASVSSAMAWIWRRLEAVEMTKKS